MTEFFEKIIAGIAAQGGFRDLDGLGHPAGDIHRPRWEGDFATSTDASKLFEEGVNVPQEAINLSRLSSVKALEKCMPDWAVQEWLEIFLQRPDLPLLADTLHDLFKHSLDFIPVPGRRRPKFFDYRVDRKNIRADFDLALNKSGPAIDPANSVFSPGEVLSARNRLHETPSIAAGVLLWQLALKTYAHELAEHALTSGTVKEPLKTRLIGYSRFLSTSAFLLASFGALVPVAIAVYEKAGLENNPARALEEFSARGGFMKHERPKLLPYLLKLFKKQTSVFRVPLLTQTRVIVCSAKEALPRWAGLSVKGKGSLAAYIDTAAALIQTSPAWKNLSAVIVQKLEKETGKPAACPFHKH